jgi:DNA modification methylase
MIKIFVGDCRDVLKTLPENSVHCCVTSPPYYGLRNYGVDGQLGLEETPDEYVANLVEVFRDVRRVLRGDGCAWVNLGDSYAGQGGYRDYGSYDNGTGRQYNSGMRPGGGNLKPKDLVGIPWRVAFALQADGWWLRSDIIWHKPNCMPESVTDRPTKAHEYVFLLSKSARYFYDADAVKENNANPSRRDYTPGRGRQISKDFRRSSGDNHRGLWSCDVAGRNKRTVWTIATHPFPGAHFATFPPALIEPMIKAGTSERGCCPRCGAPWERVVEKISHFTERPGHPVRYGNTKAMSAKGFGMPSIKPPSITTAGWQPTCACDAGDPVPCTILDLFGGAGTVGLVAEKLGLDTILIELNPNYAEMARRRILDECGQMFTEIEIKHRC